MNSLNLDDLMQQIALHEEWIDSDDQRGKQLMLNSVSVRGADLQSRTLSRCILSDVTWVDCKMQGVRIGGAELYRVRFQTCDTRELILGNCKLQGISFTHSDCRAVEFDNSQANDLSIEGCDASNVSFLRALVVRAKLSGLDLSQATFRRAIVEDSDLHDSNLTNANVSRALLKRADLHGCVLEGCVWERTWLDTVKMSGARGIPAEFTAIRTANVSITGAPDERLLQPGDEAQLEAFLRRTSST